MSDSLLYKTGWGVILVGYLPYFVGAWHNYPNGEDLWLSAVARDAGLGQSILNLLATYDSRYSTNVLHALNPLSFDWIDGYKLISMVTILLLVGAIYAFFNQLLVAKEKRWLWQFSGLSGLVFLNSIPLLTTSLYWAGGAFVYVYPFVFFLFFLSSLLRYIASPSHWSFLATAFFLVAGLGFNEMFLVTYSLTFVVLIFYRYATRQSFTSFLPLILLGGASILFFVLLPGPNARIDDTAEVLSFTFVPRAIPTTVQVLFGVLKTPTTILLLLFAVAFFANHTLAYRHPLTPTTAWRWMAILLVGLVGMIGLYYFAKQTDDYPIRIFAPITGLFIVALFLFSGLGKAFGGRLFLPAILPYLQFLLLIAATLDLTFGNNNTAALISDYTSGRMTRFSTLMEQRISTFRQCAAGNAHYKVCVVEPIMSDYPTTIYPNPDPETNQAHSIWNKYQEAYFKLDRVTTTTDTTLRIKTDRLYVD